MTEGFDLGTKLSLARGQDRCVFCPSWKDNWIREMHAQPVNSIVMRCNE